LNGDADGDKKGGNLGSPWVGGAVENGEDGGSHEDDGSGNRERRDEGQGKGGQPDGDSKDLKDHQDDQEYLEGIFLT